MFKVGDTVVSSGFKEAKRNGTWPVTEVGRGWIQINGLYTATPPHCVGDIRLVETERAFEVGDRVEFVPSGEVWRITSIDDDTSYPINMTNELDGAEGATSANQLTLVEHDNGFKVGDLVTADSSACRSGTWKIIGFTDYGIAKMVQPDRNGVAYVDVNRLKPASFQEGGLVVRGERWWKEFAQNPDGQHPMHAMARCECGSGANLTGPLHSDWCVLWRV